MFVSTTRVAQELGLSRRRISELVRTGGLDATYVAGHWVVDSSDVAKFRVLHRAQGRPWDSTLAWEMINELSGHGGDISSRAELRLLNTNAVTFIAQVQRLIQVDWYEARKLNGQNLPGCLTGDSAISTIDRHLLGSSNALHLYTNVVDVVQHCDAVRYVQGNLAVYSWRDGAQRVLDSTPSVLIAIDAARSTDARVRASGIEFVEQELSAWQEIHSQ